MEEVKVFFRHVIVCKFKINKDATETVKKNFSAYDRGVITDCQVWKWFSKLRSGGMSLRDKSRQGRASDIDQDALGEFVEYYLRKTTRGLAFDTSRSTICYRLKNIGKVSMKIL